MGAPLNEMRVKSQPPAGAGACLFGLQSVRFTWCMQEFLATLTLVMGVLLIDARGEGFDSQLAQLWLPLKAFFIGLFVVVLILGLGGPTGQTPATQDSGYRLAVAD